MAIRIQTDDLTSPVVRALISEHLNDMHEVSPAGNVHALAADRLTGQDITFWSAWINDELCGCGALKNLSSTSGEVKSMRTHEKFLRRGVAQAILDKIVQVACSRGYSRLYLETGSGVAFNAAHALYIRNGFVACEAFGDYEDTPFSVFMVKRLSLDNSNVSEAECE